MVAASLTESREARSRWRYSICAVGSWARISEMDWRFGGGDERGSGQWGLMTYGFGFCSGGHIHLCAMPCQFQHGVLSQPRVP